jgi:phosphatidate phosphatase PAH1
MNWYKKHLYASAKKKVLAVDLDGTIAEDAKFPKIGSPKSGVQKALKKLQESGYKIHIYTCRLNGKNHEDGEKLYFRTMAQITDYLEENKIPYDSIIEWSEGKPFADAYIDDKAIHFKSWQGILNELV